MLSYRPIQRNDLPALGDMFAAYVAENGEDYPRHTDPAGEFIRACQGPMDHWIGEVAVEDAAPNGFGLPSGGEPVAVLFGTLEERTFGTPRRIGRASWLYVRPTYRGAQIMPALMRRAFRRAKHLGAEVIEGGAVPGSKSARQWARFGMVPFLTQLRLDEASPGARWMLRE